MGETGHCFQEKGFLLLLFKCFPWGVKGKSLLPHSWPQYPEAGTVPLHYLPLCPVLLLLPPQT